MIRKILLILVVFCVSITTFAQKINSKKSLTVIEYKDNVNPPLTFLENAMLEEVYKDKLQDYILSQPQRLKSIKNILRNRVEIIEVNGKDISSLKKLSEVALFNNYNADLKRDVVFDKSRFNPLKYQFNFYSREGSYIRVDNTNYVILIKSQHQR